MLLPQVPSRRRYRLPMQDDQRVTPTVNPTAPGVLVGVIDSNIFIAMIPGLRSTGILLKIHGVINTDPLAASIPEL
jgi:hypothetical protein